MLAERHGGTIVNADSAQVYRDLRIVSARPPADEEARAPHRLFGHVDGADATYSAARWAAEARAAIAGVHAGGGLPILVGGTGLYIRTLLDGIAPVPDIPAEVRAGIRAMPVAEAHRLLAARDPAAAVRLAPADTTRVARALEVVEATGRTLADWQVEKAGGIGDAVDLRAAILLPDRDWLHARIDARFAVMADAARDEVAALLARRDVTPDAPVRRAIGVAEIAGLVTGAVPRDAAIAAGALATRRYAKRQYTWFRHQPPATWPRITATDDAARFFEIETLLL